MNSEGDMPKKPTAKPKAKMGRPAVVDDPVMVSLTIARTTKAAVDAWAKAAGMNRAATLRELIARGLKGKPPTR